MRIIRGLETWFFVFLSVSCAARGQPAPRLTHGPLIGHLDAHSARIWARTEGVQEIRIQVLDGLGFVSAEATARPLPERDGTVVLKVEGLAPATTYRYRVSSNRTELAGGPLCTFKTAPLPEASGRVRLAFGSCADHARFPRQRTFAAIAESSADGVVLLGDTPYIDSTETERQRKAYRAFYSVPELAACLRSRPFWATWDDHDFGANDCDGTLPNRERSRAVFLEYHANQPRADSDAGIHSKFRYGAMEVFLLDTRWHANTAPSTFDPTKPTLLGESQWEWLMESLKASTAPFKVLVSSMVWNDAVRPLKKDYWGNWPHERQALLEFLGQARITGVILVSGDIHRARVLKTKTQSVVGYDLFEFISSPIANLPMAISKMPSKDLVHDGDDPETFLLLEADTLASPPSLRARTLNADLRPLFPDTLLSVADLGG